VYLNLWSYPAWANRVIYAVKASRVAFFYLIMLFNRADGYVIMAYIKLLDVPLKCSRCGITRVALGMGHNTSLRSRLDGELPAITYDNRCPDCGEHMDIDESLRDL